MTEAQKPILFVDDDTTATAALIRALGRAGSPFVPYSAKDASSALDTIATLRPSAVILDLSLDTSAGPQSGLELIREILVRDPTTRILVLTGHNSLEFGVQAIERGAASFLAKPVESSHLLALIRDAVSCCELRREHDRLTQTGLSSIGALSSRSGPMKRCLELARYAASNSLPVLLIGETGTGKGVIARTIHESHRIRRGPFIRCQPGFSSADLVSSELFGHERGAFTGATDQRKGLLEEANGGTLFIDEVCELPAEIQILLLGTLQERRFRRIGANRERESDFRLISAMNLPLDHALKEKKLREDFFHRIAHLIIEIPPLRERSEDITDLANLFLRDITLKERFAVTGLTDDALRALRAHRWPGNVRELQAAVESGVHRANFEGRDFVGSADLEIRSNPVARTKGSFRERVRRFEIQIIRDALELAQQNQSVAARDLELDRTSLRRILKRSVAR